ncbi:hypothetical protein MANES_01G085300v8 [Manihot esculenta]|uniref:Uncharacterized protein n=1 Tax=Manihot esculenta TaxID=3983 RepID=A0A2C9WKF6_MANES|nr:hypothetical protein MANES_01G085300v8 [Manihot esculenta]
MLRKDKRGKMRVEDGVIRLYIDWRIGDVSDGASDPGRKEGRNLSLSLSSHIEAYWFLTTHHWMIFYENRTLDVQAITALSRWENGLQQMNHPEVFDHVYDFQINYNLILIVK